MAHHQITIKKKNQTYKKAVAQPLGAGPRSVGDPIPGKYFYFVHCRNKACPGMFKFTTKVGADDWAQLHREKVHQDHKEKETVS